MSLINCLDSSFSSFKKCIKYEFIDQKINYIQLAWKLACMLRPYITYNLTVGFLKYEFNNKFLGCVTRAQPYIS